MISLGQMGKNLDANDFKFTYDLVSSNWIGATNYNDWKNLVSINIINQTQLANHI